MTGSRASLRFESSPFLVIWEVTRACDLACRHCRAAAIAARNPLELTSSEGVALLREIRSFGDPLLVITGGDPLKRPDLIYLLHKSVGLGLRTTVTPSATSLLTVQAVQRIAETGVARMALSLDGPDAESHDRFRGVIGSFQLTLRALEEARRIGLPTQVNTTVTRHNQARLADIAALVGDVGAVLWSVFFLVPTGRAMIEDDLSAAEYEEVFEWLSGLAGRVDFDIKTTEAQHYRRYLVQARKAERAGRGLPALPSSSEAAIRRLRRPAINSGKGLVFISHTGNIFPSGFLPLKAGNVRQDSLLQIYRRSPLFLALRDSSRLKGKCGECEFRNLCGGSRSRAYALTADYLQEDPRCVYQPKSAQGAGIVRSASR